MRNYVTFRSGAFNTEKDKDVFLRPGRFGDDVAAWFADRLTEQGWEVDDEILQEPLGWFLTFSRNGEEFDLGVTCLNPENGTWLAWLEQPTGFFSGLFGKRHRDVASSGPNAVQQALSTSPEIGSIRWHSREQFVRGDIDEGGETPEAEPAPASVSPIRPGYLS